MSRKRNGGKAARLARLLPRGNTRFQTSGCARKSKSGAVVDRRRDAIPRHNGADKGRSGETGWPCNQGASMRIRVRLAVACAAFALVAVPAFSGRSVAGPLEDL
jgi:hypothetical protein